MTLLEIQWRIAEIKAMQDDDEVAHSMEDDLRTELLASIADGSCDDPKACAALALTTEDMDFSRWCA